jgi:hypothetical protein
MSYRRFTVNDLIDAFGHRIIGASAIEDDCVYGRDLREIRFRGSSAVFQTDTKLVVEFKVELDDGGVAFWVHPKYEVARRIDYPNSDNQVFSLSSIIKIAKAVERDERFDPGLMCDIDVFLDQETRELFEKWSETTGEPIAKLMMGAVMGAIQERRDDFTKGSKTQQDT